MIVVDVETGGLSPQKNPILSIGAVYFNDVTREFYGECNNPYLKEVTKEALEVNGMNIAHIQKQQPVKSLLEKFFEFCKDVDDYTIAGENPSFDRDFIFQNAKECGLKHKFSHRTVDLHSLVYSHMISNGHKVPIKDKKNRLSADRGYEYLGLPMEERPHNALRGARIECEAFYRVIYGQNIIPEFAQYEVPKNLLI